MKNTVEELRSKLQKLRDIRAGLKSEIQTFESECNRLLNSKKKVEHSLYEKKMCLEQNLQKAIDHDFSNFVHKNSVDIGNITKTCGQQVSVVLSFVECRCRRRRPSCSRSTRRSWKRT